MRIGINIPEELVKKIDIRAKEMYISRSAYICTALVVKLQADELVETLPELKQAIKAYNDEKEKGSLFNE